MKGNEQMQGPGTMPAMSGSAMSLAEVRRRLLIRHDEELALLNRVESLISYSGLDLEIVQQTAAAWKETSTPIKGNGTKGTEKTDAKAPRENDARIMKDKKFRLTEAVREWIAGGAQEFRTSEVKEALEAVYPWGKKQIRWGLSNALRRMATEGMIDQIDSDGRDLRWRRRKQGEATRQGHKILQEIHEEIEAGKPKA